MSQSITWLGASYPDVEYIDLPKTGGGTARFDDASVTTATASDVAQGKVFVASDGTITTGTASGGGGSSAWTKIAEKSYQVSTTSTSSATVETWGTGHSEIWTSDKIVYVRVRDTAGKRAGYFYGCDNFFINAYPANGGGSTSFSGGIRVTFPYTSEGKYPTANNMSTGTSGFGVYADTIYTDGRIRVRRRYSSSSSLTIDGTYKVEVYLLDPAGGVPIFT